MNGIKNVFDKIAGIGHSHLFLILDVRYAPISVAKDPRTISKMLPLKILAIKHPAKSPHTDPGKKYGSIHNASLILTSTKPIANGFETSVKTTYIAATIAASVKNLTFLFCTIFS